MRRLVVDGQVFHTPALYRGMGKYSLELLDKLNELNIKWHLWDEIDIVLSSLLPLPAEAAALLKLKAKNARLVKLPLKKDEIFNAQSVMAENRQVIDRYIESLNSKSTQIRFDFLILSPLQGGVTSVFPSNPSVCKAVIFYDLIPFMFHEIYFRNPVAKMENLTKIGELLKADIFFGISKTVSNDLAIYLGVEPSRIRNIDGGPINHATQAKSVDVPRPFILMPTGNELRKNNRAGVLGFKEFNRTHHDQYSLIITSFFDPDQADELSRLAPNVILPGNVSGEELYFLYENCEALLFPSLYEGLGLPVLEAVAKYKPVACSDIGVFREMSKTAFHYFDPMRVASISMALEDAANTKPDLKEYDVILKKYSWDKCAREVINTFSDYKISTDLSRPSVAIFGVNPECDSPLGRELQRAHAELSRYFEPHYFQEGKTKVVAPRVNMLPFLSSAAQIDGEVPINIDHYDAIIYHLANTDKNIKTLFSALAKPGIVILHDLDLSRAWVGMKNAGLICDDRLKLEKKLQEIYGGDRTHLLCSVVAHQKALIVFSEKAKEAVSALNESLHIDVPIVLLSQPVGEIVYKDALPTKQEKIGIFKVGKQRVAKELISDERSVEKLFVISQSMELSKANIPQNAKVYIWKTDREFEDIISRLRLIHSLDAESLRNALEGLKYSTSVTYSNDRSTQFFKVPGTMLIESLDELDSIVAKSSIEVGGTTWPYSRGSYVSFSESLYSIVMSLIENGVK